MQNLPVGADAIPTLMEIASRCDHIDVKTFHGQGRMDAFIAGFISYYPAWIKALYGVRWGFVRLLGMKQTGIPDEKLTMQPQDVPMKRGQPATFFTVVEAEVERYWLVSASDKHLSAFLCILNEQGESDSRIFTVITLVEYRHWTGPVYFNVIRPFHHLVVNEMGKAGVRASALNELSGTAHG